MPSVDVVVPVQFTDPIYQELMIDPVKTNCKKDNGSEFPHVFEKLPLAKWLRSNTSCPVCRYRITEAVPDEALALRIQNEFVNVSEANKRFFDDRKAELDTDSEYNDIRSEPVMPRVARRPSTEMTFAELMESLRVLPRPHYPPPEARPLTDANLYSQIQSDIRADNLTAAEIKADRITPGIFWKNVSYEKIADAHISKADSNLTHLDHATRVTSKISSVQTKSYLFAEITLAYMKHAKFSKAFDSMKKISNPFIKLFLGLFVIGGAALFGIIFVLTKVFETLRKLADNVRARLRRLSAR